MSVAFQVQLKIRKPLAEVFDAVADEKKLTGYFVQNSSGPFVAGQTLTWKFDEAPQPTAVVVREVVKNQRIVFDWPTSDPNVLTTVTIAFVPIDAANTMVQIAEGGWANTPEGLKDSHGNAGGWMHMLACLKGYLEYGINLRAGGAF